MKRVLLVDDHAAFREPLAFMFEREAGSLDEARRLLAGIDLAVIDLDLPDGDGPDRRATRGQPARNGARADR